jgi:hypothetical protein
LGWLGGLGVKERLAELVGDEAGVELYDADRLRLATVGQLAAGALERI